MKYLQALMSVLCLLAVLAVVSPKTQKSNVLSSLQMQEMMYPGPPSFMRRTDTGDLDALADMQMLSMYYPRPVRLSRRLETPAKKYCTYNVDCDGWMPDALNKCVCVHPEEDSIIGHCVC